MKISAATLLLLCALAALSSATKRRAGRRASESLNGRMENALQGMSATHVRIVHSLDQIKSAAVSYAVQTSKSSAENKEGSQVKSKWDLMQPGVLEQVMRGVNPDRHYSYANGDMPPMVQSVRFSNANRADPSDLKAGANLADGDVEGGDQMNWAEAGAPKSKSKIVDGNKAITGKGYVAPKTQTVEQTGCADLKIAGLPPGPGAIPNCGATVVADNFVPVQAGHPKVAGIDVDDPEKTVEPLPSPGTCGDHTKADPFLGSLKFTEMPQSQQNLAIQACQVGAQYGAEPGNECLRACVEAMAQQFAKEAGEENRGLATSACKWGCNEVPVPKHSGLEKMRQMIMNEDPSLEKGVDAASEAEAARSGNGMGGVNGPDYSKNLEARSNADQMKTKLAGAAEGALNQIGGVLGGAAAAVGLPLAVGGSSGGGEGVTAAQQAAAVKPGRAAMKATGVIPDAIPDGGAFADNGGPPPAPPAGGAGTQALNQLQSGDAAGAAKTALKSVPGLASLMGGKFRQVRSNSSTTVRGQ